MLFPSYVFLFVFLPIVFVGAVASSRLDQSRGAALWLVLASLCFYAWWRPHYLPLLLGSAAFNFSWGLLLSQPARRSRAALAFGVGANLALLGWFKYAEFGARTIEQLTGFELELDPIVLPLAISFFTFQQIAYLVEVWRGGSVEKRPMRYALFVSFFPQLIAGPIVHYDEVKSQISGPGTLRVRRANVEIGLAYLVMGLFKKVVLADGIAPTANLVFGAAAAGTIPSFVEAWLGSLAYALQIYFDFSGYSDMAIGLGLLFGVRLPFNFDSPYQATSIIDFWRRWHMTLSRFLRDHVYIALGGNRRGPARRYGNLVITMLLGGLWHGAAWSFVVWGGVHGLYLLVNHAWRALRSGHRGSAQDTSPAGRAFARALTFLAVTVAWVFFRAEDFGSAWLVLTSMAGLVGSAGAELLDARDTALAMLVPLLIAWFAPNTQRILGAFTPTLAGDPESAGGGSWRFAWRATPAWALALAGAATWAILEIGGVNEFLYFNF